VSEATRPGGGTEDRLKRRLLAGAVDDNLRAIRNEPRGKLHKRPPLMRWAVPAALAAAALAVGSWALFFRPKPPERVVYAPLAPVTANGPTSTERGESGAGPIELPEPASHESVPTRLPSHVFPLAVRRVVIDPGHGGTDEGTKTAYGLTEKILTLDVAQRLALRLVTAGYEVSLTRESDVRLYLRDRVRFANQRDADLFVSIHVNWLQDGRANRGIETYYLGPSDDPYITALAAAENRESGYSMADARSLLDGIYSDLRQQQSRRLATSVQRSLLAAAREASSEVRDRGVRSAPFLVLVETEMPAILAEVASLSSAEEARLLTREEYRERIATALYDGIRAYSAPPERFQAEETSR
jgi:N-acetylmuramoyl-L-alanine amidase